MAMSGKKPEEAIQVLQPHEERFSQDFTVQYLLGTAFYQIKDFINSKVHLSKALAIYPQSRNTKHNLALIYDSTGDWVESDKLYIDLISTDSTDAQAYNNYAYSLVERNENLNKALKMAKKAISLEPKNASYLDTIGWIYFKLNKIDKAKEYLESSLEIVKDNSVVLEHLGDVLMKDNKQKEAIDYYKRALALDKDNPKLIKKVSLE